MVKVDHLESLLERGERLLGQMDVENRRVVIEALVVRIFHVPSQPNQQVLSDDGCKRSFPSLVVSVFT